jgi:hypothetical protein
MSATVPLNPTIIPAAVIRSHVHARALRRSAATLLDLVVFFDPIPIPGGRS